MREQVQEITAPGSEGYFGVQPKHTYFVTKLKKGVISVRWGNQSRQFDVDGGVIQVTPDKVAVCAEKAELCKVKTA